MHIRRFFLTFFFLALSQASPASAAQGVAVRKWRVLGPFPVGKNELDGEPWLTSNASELVRGGASAWKKLTAGADGMLTIDWPEADWQSLVNGVGGHELLEWQALARGSFSFDREGLAMLSCQGVSAFRLDSNPVPFVGDQYNAGLPGHPVELAPGKHTLLLRLRAKVRGSLACRVEARASPVVTAVGGVLLATPDIVDGALPSDLLAVPVSNDHPTEWLHEPRVVPAGREPLPVEVLPTELQPPLLPLAPGQLARLPVRVRLRKSGCPSGPLAFAVEGLLGGELVRSTTLSLPALRCRTRSQSFIFTFMDADGSVQHAAAVAPQGRAACEGAAGCPVVVTLHGTSISASDSADSYKMKGAKDAEYRFGVAGAWLLAPTRHGAHNWEGPGLVTASSALAALTLVAPALALQGADRHRLVLAGHSMGGHGAWLLTLAFRDAALGLVSSASWLRKDQYADSNKVLLHDIAVPDVEPALAAILKAAESEFDVDSHAATLAGGLDILVRVGSKDQTCHPWFSRRIVRSLLAAGAATSETTLTEIQGKEHWWWDTSKPNDGGAVNDGQIRKFLRESLSRSSAASRLPPSWRLVLHNPATMGAKGGARVLQQIVPFRRSEVSVRTTITEEGEALLEVFTSNVRRLEWVLSSLAELLDARCGASLTGRACTHMVELDGVPLEIPVGLESAMWCWTQNEEWAPCSDMVDYASVQRGPGSWGPMRQVFTHPTCAVVGRKDASSSLRAAKYIANLQVMTGYGYMPLLHDDDALDAGGNLALPSACRSLVAIGHPGVNRASLALLHGGSGSAIDAPGGYKPPLTVEQDGDRLSIGRCSWTGGDVVGVALLPWWPRGSRTASPHLGLLITSALAGEGASESAAEAAALLATPTIPPMTRQPFTHLLPDYVVLDISEVRRRGAGGFLAAGYWGYSWQYEPLAAWEKYCRPRRTRRAVSGRSTSERVEL